MNIKRLKTFFFFTIAKLPMNGHKRCKYISLGGVDCADKRSFIGEGVVFDTMHPEYIHLGNRVHITARTMILTHYLRSDMPSINWRTGHVYIGDDTFIGLGTIICNDISIGKNCIIGAGSVVTKNIPDNEIWAGNPAKFIKKR